MADGPLASKLRKVTSEKSAKKEKTPKKPKAKKESKGYADYHATMLKRREDALNAALMLFAGSDKPNVEELIRATQKRVSSFEQTKIFLATEWNADGTRKPPVVKEGYQGIYRIRTFAADPGPGFVGQIWHFENDATDSRVQIVDFTSSLPCTTPEFAKQVCYAYADLHGISKRILKNFRIWYEGERDFETDKQSLSATRHEAISAVSRLVKNGGDKSSTPDAVDDLIISCRIPLDRYYSIKWLFDSRWNSEGVWIGPKRPAKKNKTTKLKPLAHLLGNFKARLESGNWDEAQNRIVHAIKNFKGDDLKQFAAMAEPFADNLTNYLDLLLEATK